jgi:hypothetical protein
MSKIVRAYQSKTWAEAPVYTEGFFQRHPDLSTENSKQVIVIDPDDLDQAKELINVLIGHANDPEVSGALADYEYGNLMTGLRSLFRAPDLPEPAGLGVLVTDAKGKRWVSVQGASRTKWRQVEANRLAAWRDVQQPARLGWDA